MRNHDLVPVDLIMSIAKLRSGMYACCNNFSQSPLFIFVLPLHHYDLTSQTMYMHTYIGGAHKILSTLLRHKLLAHANQQYDGYRLSYLGFDILALKALVSRGTVASVGSQIGVGKESDIFEAQNLEGEDLVIKIHRLGRTSFRAVRKQRDYMKGKTKASWLYMSRLAAIKEYAFMRALYEHKFPVPTPFDQNRHIVAMSRVAGFPMAQIKTGQMEGAEGIFSHCIDILKRLAQHGLIHCDYNEFNLMISSEGDITMIDFPQMVSTNHPNAIELFNRDVNGLYKFFSMKMRYQVPDELIPKLEDIISSDLRIDEEVRGCGTFTSEDDEELVRYINFESDIQSAPSRTGRKEDEDQYYEDEDEDENEGEGEGDDDFVEGEDEDALGFNEGVFGPATSGGIYRPNFNTATYDHDFTNETLSSRGSVTAASTASSRKSSRSFKYSFGGGAPPISSSIFTRADKRNVVDPEDITRIAEKEAAAIEAVKDAEAGVAENENEADGSDLDLYEELEEDESIATTAKFMIDTNKVKQNVKRDKSKDGRGSVGKSNLTKKRKCEEV